jgi:hypothetical protein
VKIVRVDGKFLSEELVIRVIFANRSFNEH